MIDAFLADIRRLYGTRASVALVSLMVSARHNPLRYLGRFWSTQRYGKLPLLRLSGADQNVADVVRLGMIAQAVAGIVLAVVGAFTARPDQLLFGLALFVSYPLVWAHLLPVVYVVALPSGIKALGKRIICHRLEKQVMQLRVRHQFALVAVAGSVGKTSTKLAIADALSGARRVRYQEGNYNDRLTVPLIVFGHDEPGLYNVMAWLRILRANRRQIRGDFPYDVVVVEIGTDGSGQMAKFAYLQPELTILTSVSPEHMEQFGTLDAVAKEELKVFDYSQRVLVNVDDVDASYLVGREYVAYGTKDAAFALVAASPAKKLGSQRVTFSLAGHKLSESVKLVGQQGAKIALAAAATATELALSIDDVKSALKRLKPFAGRMQILLGIKRSTIIDDTYNASPSAVVAALAVLQGTDAPQRIAILGSMNELGDTSQSAHEAAGKLCDPKTLDLVITIGRDAQDYLAPAATAAGCRVQSFLNPHEAGEYVKSQLKTGAVVLAKGSQNGVFAEESLKPLLKDAKDADKLVRQSDYWLGVKRAQFGD